MKVKVEMSMEEFEKFSQYKKDKESFKKTLEELRDRYLKKNFKNCKDYVGIKLDFDSIIIEHFLDTI